MPFPYNTIVGVHKNSTQQNLTHWLSLPPTMQSSTTLVDIRCESTVELQRYNPHDLIHTSCLQHQEHNAVFLRLTYPVPCTLLQRCGTVHLHHSHPTEELFRLHTCTLPLAVACRIYENQTPIRLRTRTLLIAMHSMSPEVTNRTG